MRHLITLTRRLQLRALSLANINNGRQHEQSFRSLNWVEADFDRNLSAVFAKPKKLPFRAHRPSACVAKITVPVLHVMRPESLGNKRLDGSANELLTAITEDGFCLRVDQGDTAFRVHRNHGAGCRLHHQTELFFSLLALGDVECSATHSSGLTVAIKLNLPPARDPPQLSIGEQNPVLGFVLVASAQGVLYSLEHPLPILRMQHVFEAFQV